MRKDAHTCVFHAVSKHSESGTVALPERCSGNNNDIHVATDSNSLFMLVTPQEAATYKAALRRIALHRIALHRHELVEALSCLVNGYLCS